LHSFHPIGSKK
jgi:hypothetical protein